VDVVLLRRSPQGVEVLLVRRRHPPFAGRWALPGGFVNKGETLKEAAHRELQEETGLTAEPLYQLAAYGDPGRDPRGWTVSVVFWGWIAEGRIAPRAGDDAAEVRWWPLKHLPALAFDHAEIIADALKPAMSKGPSR